MSRGHGTSAPPSRGRSTRIRSRSARTDWPASYHAVRGGGGRKISRALRSDRDARLAFTHRMIDLLSSERWTSSHESCAFQSPSFPVPVVVPVRCSKARLDDSGKFGGSSFCTVKFRHDADLRRGFSLLDLSKAVFTVTSVRDRSRMACFVRVNAWDLQRPRPWRAREGTRIVSNHPRRWTNPGRR